MDYFSRLGKYIPVITTLLAAYLTYFFGYRKSKLQQFHNQCKENLNDILSPMFHHIRCISRIETAFQREKNIKEFFERYSNESDNLYKIGDRSIINSYYNTEDLFYTFLNNRSETNWEKFWISFHELYKSIDEEYNRIRDIIYCNYTWMRYINEKNYILRLIFELIAFLYETIRFLFFAGYILLIPIICEYFRGTDLICKNGIKLYLMVLCIVTMMFLMLVTCSSDYKLIKKNQKRKGVISKAMEKKFPQMAKIINIFLYTQIKEEKNDIKIPRMYED